MTRFEIQKTLTRNQRTIALLGLDLLAEYPGAVTIQGIQDRARRIENLKLRIKKGQKQIEAVPFNFTEDEAGLLKQAFGTIVAEANGQRVALKHRLREGEAA